MLSSCFVKVSVGAGVGSDSAYQTNGAIKFQSVATALKVLYVGGDAQVAGDRFISAFSTLIDMVTVESLICWARRQPSTVTFVQWQRQNRTDNHGICFLQWTICILMSEQ